MGFAVGIALFKNDFHYGVAIFVELLGKIIFRKALAHVDVG